MTEGEKSELGTIDAPYNKQVRLQDIDFDGTMHLMRITIKEGSRFTQLDPLIIRYRLAAGEGVICNNVLHNRTGFDLS